MTAYADNIAQELDRVIKAQEKLTAKMKEIRRSVLINDGVVSPQMAEEAADLEKAWIATRKSVEENLKRIGRERHGAAALALQNPFSSDEALRAHDAGARRYGNLIWQAEAEFHDRCARLAAMTPDQRERLYSDYKAVYRFPDGYEVGRLQYAQWQVNKWAKR